MRHKLLAAIALTAFIAIPAIAEAAEGFATANVNMRSGPSTQYPAVTMIPVGTPLEINGCLNETPWCDVSFLGGRGWVAGQYIQATYQSRRIYVGPRYYRPLGIPTITFNLNDYWDRYYRGRDFYRDRDRWRRGPGWVDRRPDRGWDRGSDWNDGSDSNWNRRPDRNRDWDQQNNDDWRRQRDRNRDWGGQDNNQDWGRQQPDDNQGWGNRQDRRRDNNRQDDQQRRPQPQQQQAQPQQVQPQQGQNNPRPNAGSPGPYSPDHVDPCPAAQPDCRMTPRGFNR
jgi:uncharacterized protein YraI